MSSVRSNSCVGCQIYLHICCSRRSRDKTMAKLQSNLITTNVTFCLKSGINAMADEERVPLKLRIQRE